jgi:RNA polymerase sigma-70 factor (ECF subfamily)
LDGWDDERSVPSPPAGDRELLAQWATGDQAPGGHLFRRHFEVVHRFFQSRVGADAEDLVQDTFLGCIEGRHRFRGECAFKTFLLAIARHRLFNHYRQTRKGQLLDFGLRSSLDLATAPMVGRDEERMLARALQRIPVDLQIVLELTYWEEMDGPEIARLLDVPLNTAYSRLRRAREELRKILADLPPDTHPGSSTLELAEWAQRTWQAVEAVRNGPPSGT